MKCIFDGEPILGSIDEVGIPVVLVPELGPPSSTPNGIRGLLLEGSLHVLGERDRLLEPCEVENVLGRSLETGDEQDSLPHLGNAIVAALDDGMRDGIPCISQMLADVLEGIALVVRDERRDVLKDDDLRSPRPNPSHDLEEDGSARVVKSAMLSRIRERLAREARTEDIKLGKRLRRNGVDVAERLNPVVCAIGLSSNGINVTSENALHPMLDEGPMEASDPTADVDKGPHSRVPVGRP
jgi:hypothetical protein